MLPHAHRCAVAVAASLLLYGLAPNADAGLARYAALVLADANVASAPADSIRVTYLGVNGYQLEANGEALLVDPYFSRVGFWPVATNQPIASDPPRVAAGLSHIQRHVAAILVTHAHFDHLLDVPAIARRTGARIIGDETTANLVQSLGLPRERCVVIKPRQTKKIGAWKITVLAAEHDHLFGSTPPFPGRVTTTANAPERPSDWKLGQPLAFLIEANDRRIYIDSGGTIASKLPAVRVDLAILGVALPDSRRRFASAVRTLSPRYILPSHQDDFFKPFQRGFTFGKLSGFPNLLRMHEREDLPGRLILLDYFRPWTIR